MTDRAIPAEAIVAATKVLYADRMSNHAGDNAPQIIDACETIVKKILEVAAPHIAASVWDEAMKVASEVAWEHDGSASSVVPEIPNPYRTAK